MRVYNTLVSRDSHTLKKNIWSAPTRLALRTTKWGPASSVQCINRRRCALPMLTELGRHLVVQPTSSNLISPQLVALTMAPNSTPLTAALTATAAVAIASSIACVFSMQGKIQAERKCEYLEEELTALQMQLKQADGDKNQTHQQQRQRKKQLPTIGDETAINGGLFVKPVGTIRSIYKLCVGTPRQGLLVPNARGCIELEKIGDSSTSSSVIGLEGYSHVWIIFVFHLNTKSSNPKRIKSKISPPALGGDKVGIFATRSPHRFNPIGITLCKVDRIEKVAKTKHTKERTLIHISGLDLVDGTPVLDIKPFVPIYDSAQNVNLPPWVEGGLATSRNVIIDQSARDDLLSILEKDKDALQFYGPAYGEDTVQKTLEYAMKCIEQVLAIDVRSNYQTKKAREGKFQAERARRLQDTSVGLLPSADTADICTQQIDNLLIEYTVAEASDQKRASSAGSGAEDEVTVSSIKLIQEG